MLTLDDLTRLGRRFAHSVRGADNEVQEVFALRSDLPLDRYRLHPDEVEGVVSVGIGRRDRVVRRSRRCRARARASAGQRLGVPTVLEVAVSDFAAGEIGGYAVARPARVAHRRRTVACRSRSSFAERWCAGG